MFNNLFYSLSSLLGFNKTAIVFYVVACALFTVINKDKMWISEKYLRKAFKWVIHTVMGVHHQAIKFTNLIPINGGGRAFHFYLLEQKKQ